VHHTWDLELWRLPFASWPLSCDLLPKAGKSGESIYIHQQLRTVLLRRRRMSPGPDCLSTGSNPKQETNFLLSSTLGYRVVGCQGGGVILDLLPHERRREVGSSSILYPPKSSCKANQEGGSSATCYLNPVFEASPRRKVVGPLSESGPTRS